MELADLHRINKQAIGLSSSQLRGKQLQIWVKYPATHNLPYYDQSKSLTLQVDVSTHGIRAGLIQDQGPIAFASKELTETESRYSNIEREMLGIVYAFTIMLIEDLSLWRLTTDHWSASCKRICTTHRRDWPACY